MHPLFRQTSSFSDLLLIEAHKRLGRRKNGLGVNASAQSENQDGVIPRRKRKRKKQKCKNRVTTDKGQVIIPLMSDAFDTYDEQRSVALTTDDGVKKSIEQNSEANIDTTPGERRLSETCEVETMEEGQSIWCVQACDNEFHVSNLKGIHFTPISSDQACTEDEEWLTGTFFDVEESFESCANSAMDKGIFCGNEKECNECNVVRQYQHSRDEDNVYEDDLHRSLNKVSTNYSNDATVRSLNFDTYCETSSTSAFPFEDISIKDSSTEKTLTITPIACSDVTKDDRFRRDKQEL